MAHVPEPWIWLQEYEASGEADCGCRLDSLGPTEMPGAAFYLCPKHDAAPELLAVLERCVPVLGKWSNSRDFEPTNPEDDYCQELVDALAAIGKAKGKDRR